MILLGGFLLTTIVQKTIVQPNELAQEKPYIERNIFHTRAGFGLDKIVSAIRSTNPTGIANQGWSVQLISYAFVGTGVVAMAAATHVHRKNLKRLSRQEFTYKEEPSLAAATAVMITLIGLVAIVLLMIGGAGR
jgi:uncharacterized membrane protein YidH (DUF202 family)